MMTIAEKLKEVETLLRASGIPNARSEASLLIALATGRDKTFLIAHPEYSLNLSESGRLDEFARRRAAHEPYQYIAGRQEFFGLDFLVTPDVLIPRPETELIVERAIEILGPKWNASICEIGVGSGCIAISILHHLPNATAFGVDVSDSALDVARRNAERLGVGGRLVLRRSDLYSSFDQKRFQMIVSNPPYIPLGDREGLQSEVRDFEPESALFGGTDGLDVIEKIVSGAPEFLAPGARLLVEIGIGQSEKVVEMFNQKIWRRPELLLDLQGIPRVVDGMLIDGTPEG